MSCSLAALLRLTCVPLLSFFTLPQDLDIYYIAFDVLHDGTSPLINKPLAQRLKVLAELVKDGAEPGALRGRARGMIVVLRSAAWLHGRPQRPGLRRPHAQPKCPPASPPPPQPSPPPPVSLNGSCVRGRVVALLPEHTHFAGRERVASRYGRTEADIKEAMEKASCCCCCRSLCYLLVQLRQLRGRAGQGGAAPRARPGLVCRRRPL